MRGTRVVIHLDNLKRNITLIRERAGGRAVCASVKADAYGHGAVPVARSCLEAGARCLAVATVDEAAELRLAGIRAPILLLSPPMPSELSRAALLDLTLLAGDNELIAAYNAAAEAVSVRATVHLKVDTGMGRAGCRPSDAALLARQAASLPNIRLKGMATHLAVSDSQAPSDTLYTKEQIRRFVSAVDAVRAEGIDPGVVHAAASGGILLHEDAWFDMVRPGILLYGYAPSWALEGILSFEPVMELESHIVFIKDVKQGESISYGRTWTAPYDTRVATLPIGYGDGLNRLLSNRWSVLIGNRLYPIVGRICMDQCMVDIGMDSPIKKYDKAVIFGGSLLQTDISPQNAPTMQNMAALLGTIPYEITCSITRRVPRVF